MLKKLESIATLEFLPDSQHMAKDGETDKNASIKCYTIIESATCML